MLKDVQESGGPPDLLQKRKKDIEIVVGSNKFSFYQLASKQLYELIDYNYDGITVNIRKKRSINICFT